MTHLVVLLGSIATLPPDCGSFHHILQRVSLCIVLPTLVMQGFPAADVVLIIDHILDNGFYIVVRNIMELVDFLSILFHPHVFFTSL